MHLFILGHLPSRSRYINKHPTPPLSLLDRSHTDSIPDILRELSEPRELSQAREAPS
jgi:hypothetical protein